MATPERTRTVEWSDPAEHAARLGGRSGVETLRAIFGGDLPRPPFGVLLGLRGVDVEEGRVTFEVEPAEYHYNPLGSVHGGLLASLLDSAMGCAVHSSLPAGRGYSTIELKVSLLRPVTVATGTLTAVGTTLRVGRTVAFAEGRVEDPDGRLVAHGTTSCAVFAITQPVAVD
jgi:uncharacterized protein (TIGR00369 family)